MVNFIRFVDLDTPALYINGCQVLYKPLTQNIQEEATNLWRWLPHVPYKTSKELWVHELQTMAVPHYEYTPQN